MDKNTQEKIFEPFFTTNSEQGGTGLGLFVVHNIITSHQGVILCNSIPDKSTEFKIILPLIEKKEESISKSSEILKLQQSDKKYKILVIDDNLRILRLIEKGLTSVNMVVCAKNSPKEGLEEIKKQDFDLILTDYSMRDLNGLNIAIHAHQKKFHIPIIVITGLLDIDIIEAKQTHLIDDYILKPVTIQTLTEKIYQYLNFSEKKKRKS